MPVYAFGEFEIDLERFVLLRDGAPVSIGPRAFDVLTYLIRHQGRPVSKQELVSNVWGVAALSYSAVPTTINEVRKALGDPRGSRGFVLTVPKRGYRFAIPVRLLPDVGGATSETASEVDKVPSGLSAIFVGRRRELALMNSALAESRAGEPRLILLTGEPGIGKTRTSEEFLLRARREGCATAVARCHESEGAPAFWPWVQVARACIRNSAPSPLTDAYGPLLPYLVPLLETAQPKSEATGLAFADPSPQAIRFKLFDAMTRLLQQASTDRPMILAIDDLHRADLASLELLQFVIRELRDAQIVIVGTYRDAELPRDSLQTHALASLIREPRSRVIPLSRLSLDDVAQYLENVVPIELYEAHLAEALHDRSGGNPFFLTQLVQLLALREPNSHRGTQIDPEEALPSGLREAIARQIESLPPSTKQVLAAAAVNGREFGLAELSAALVVPIEQLLASLAPALEARLVSAVEGHPRSYRFNHVLLRDALLEGVEPAERSKLHRQLGEAIEAIAANDLDSRASELAHHFVQAARGGSSETAIRYSVRAARRAAAQLAFEDACQHYRLAIGLIESSEQADPLHLCEMLLALGEAEIRAGEREASHETLLRAVTLARMTSEPNILARAALGLAPRLFTIEAGIADPLLIGLLEEALLAVGEVDSTLRASVLARLATALAWSNPEHRWDTLSRQALEVARRVDDPTTIGLALIARHGGLWAPKRLAERIEVLAELGRSAERSTDEGLRQIYLILEIALNLELGEIAQVDQKIDAFTRFAQAQRDPHALWYVDLFQLVRAAMDSRPRDAKRHERAVLEQGQRVRDRNAMHAFSAHVVLRCWEEAQAASVVEKVAEMTDAFPAIAAWRAALAFTYSEIGRKADALREFEHVAIQDFTNIRWNEAGTIAFTLLAEVCAYLGDKRRASRLYEILLPASSRYIVIGFASAFCGSIARHLGLLATTLDRFDDAASHFEFALVQDARVGAPKFVAQSQCDYAQLLMRRNRPGDRERVEILVTEALGTASRLDLHRLRQKLIALRKDGRGEEPMTA